MILQIQKLLNSLFSSGLTEDGILGPKTKAAIMMAQQKLGMIADGSPSSTLLMKLESNGSGTLDFSPSSGESFVSKIKTMMKNNPVKFYTLVGSVGAGLLLLAVITRKKSQKTS